MYGSRYYSSNYYSSNYYGGSEEEETSGGGYTGDGIVHTAKSLLLKQIKGEDEIIISFIAAFFEVVVL